jgi:hypothetical protein
MELSWQRMLDWLASPSGKLNCKMDINSYMQWYCLVLEVTSPVCIDLHEIMILITSFCGVFFSCLLSSYSARTVLYYF